MNLSIIHPILAEGLLALLAISLLLVGAYYNSKKKDTLICIFTVLGMGFVITMIGALPTDINQNSLINNMYVSNDFTQLFKILILISTIVSLALAYAWLPQNSHGNGRSEYPVLLLFTSIGLMLMVSSNNFLALYVGLELASLSMYVIASYNRDSGASTEAGMKYFILGSLASGMLLYGISLIYGFAGSIEFSVIAGVFQNSDTLNLGLVIGLVFVIAAFCFKISAVPFHMWTADVYQGTPTAVVAFFATAPKIAMLALLARLSSEIFIHITDTTQQILVTVCAASMIVGAVGALAQQNLKRIIAFSSIGHVGYMLLAIISNSTRGIESLYIYLVIYMMMSFGVFATLLLLKEKDVELTQLNQLKGLSQSHPVIAALFSIQMFSMAGIPPFIGFFAKMFVFTSALQAGYVLLVVVAAISSVVSCFYYIRIVKIMYFDSQTVAPDVIKNPSVAWYVLWISVLLNLLLLSPSLVMSPAKEAAKVLFP
jgi:NADH-quinone oxidoreductase subunit N